MRESVRRVRAVAAREIRELARSRTPFVLRTIFGLLMGVFVFGPFMSLLTSPRVYGSTLAFQTHFVFRTAAYLQGPLLMLLGVVLGVASATSEKRNRTLGLLVLSRLRGWEVVAGKTLALLALNRRVVPGPGMLNSSAALCTIP